MICICAYVHILSPCSVGIAFSAERAGARVCGSREGLPRAVVTETESQEETGERGYTAAVRSTNKYAEIVESTPGAKIVGVLDAYPCARAGHLRRCAQYEVRPSCGGCMLL